MQSLDSKYSRVLHTIVYSLRHTYHSEPFSIICATSCFVLTLLISLLWVTMVILTEDVSYKYATNIHNLMVTGTFSALCANQHNTYRYDDFIIICVTPSRYLSSYTLRTSYIPHRGVVVLHIGVGRNPTPTPDTNVQDHQGGI